MADRVPALGSGPTDGGSVVACLGFCPLGGNKALETGTCDVTAGDDITVYLLSAGFLCFSD